MLLPPQHNNIKGLESIKLHLSTVRTGADLYYGDGLANDFVEESAGDRDYRQKIGGQGG